MQHFCFSLGRRHFLGWREGPGAFFCYDTMRGRAAPHVVGPGGKRAPVHDALCMCRRLGPAPWANTLKTDAKTLRLSLPVDLGVDLVVDLVWIWCGFFPVGAWILRGFGVDFAWIFFGARFYKEGNKFTQN